ncbi:MAG: TIGR03668 family PPOX class F420-dependent oxidoreductase [Gammaproteobacteria bacterium]|nr:MAG: TIGR03668 family PPOX class F420-dependent oxidoreductase [Gammaproteobacteria bacterium]
MKIDNELLKTLMHAWPVARLATASREGKPHTVPIVFVVDGVHLYSPIDGKSKRGTPLKRLRNIEENSAVTILLDAYHDDWQRLWWVRLDGKAERFMADETKARVLEKLLLAKYPQYEDHTLLPRDAQFLRITWHLGAVWAQSGDPTQVIEQAISELIRPGHGR